MKLLDFRAQKVNSCFSTGTHCCAHCLTMNIRGFYQNFLEYTKVLGGKKSKLIRAFIDQIVHTDGLFLKEDRCVIEVKTMIDLS